MSMARLIELEARNERVLNEAFELSRSNKGKWVDVTVEKPDGSVGVIQARCKGANGLEVR